MNRKQSGANKSKTRFMPGVTEEHRITPHASTPKITKDMLIQNMLNMMKRLGHFPTQVDYWKTPGNYAGSPIYRGLGHTASAALCGYFLHKRRRPGQRGGWEWFYSNTPPQTTTKRRQSTTEEYSCFNAELCVVVPPMRVEGPREYCSRCKTARGWYD